MLVVTSRFPYTIKEEQGFGGHTKTLGEGSDEGRFLSVFGKLRTFRPAYPQTLINTPLSHA